MVDLSVDELATLLDALEDAAYLRRDMDGVPDDIAIHRGKAREYDQLYGKVRDAMHAKAGKEVVNG